jgi:hypothetical protein
MKLFKVIKHVFVCMKHKAIVFTCEKTDKFVWKSVINFNDWHVPVIVLSGDPVTVAWRVLRLRMEEKPSIYVG